MIRFLTAATDRIFVIGDDRGVRLLSLPWLALMLAPCSGLGTLWLDWLRTQFCYTAAVAVLVTGFPAV